MKITFSTLRLILPAVVGLFAVSCGKNKVADANPYQNNPYYGPNSSNYGTGAATDITPPAGNTGGGGYTDYANSGGNSGGSNYPNYSDNSTYTPPAAAPAPTYNDTYAANTYSGGGGNHTVQRGDTLYSLSRRYGTSVAAIQSANGLNSDLIRLGQTLTIPKG